MTVTITLPPALLKRAQQVADERDTDINSLALEVFLEYLEELEDIEEAREQTARLQRGETHLISMEDVHADIMAMDDMKNLKE